MQIIIYLYCRSSFFPLVARDKDLHRSYIVQNQVRHQKAWSPALHPCQRYISLLYEIPNKSIFILFSPYIRSIIALSISPVNGNGSKNFVILLSSSMKVRSLAFHSPLALKLLIFSPCTLLRLTSLSFTHYAPRSSVPKQLPLHQSPLASSSLQKHENAKIQVYFAVATFFISSGSGWTG